MAIAWVDTPELWAALSLYEDRWKFVYPGLELDREVLRMAEWIEANPQRAPKKNYKAFMVRWLARNQASMERVELREQIQRAQRHVDASVGKYRGV